MCAALAARGHSVDVMTTNVDGHGVLDVPTGVPVAREEVTFHYFRVQRPRYFLPSASLGAALARQVPRTNVVHVHSLYRFHSLAACHYSRKHGVPYVLRPHGTLTAYHRERKVVRKRIYERLVEWRNLQHAAAIHYTSAQEMRATEEFGVRRPGYVIPLGVDVDEFSRPAERSGLLQAHPQLAQPRPYVLFLGRITKKKRLGLLLDAFAAVARERGDAHLVIAGPDDEGLGSKLARRIDDLGLRSRVSSLGLVQGELKRALLQLASVFVLPSAEENFSVAVAEAMAAGLPVIVTREVALQTDVADAGAGLVSEATPRGLSEALNRVLDSPELSMSCGANGRRLVASKYSWDRVAADLEALYLAVS